MSKRDATVGTPYTEDEQKIAAAVYAYFIENELGAFAGNDSDLACVDIDGDVNLLALARFILNGCPN